ncbi:MAG TPA: hypothetical protein VFR17_14340, partial [Mycobacterium sp.]|nr:hypothetical protein [Mycobacterium sp.]
MQQVLRPYATAGIALVGAGLIVATPVIRPALSTGPVALATELTSVSYTDVFNEASSNLNTIFEHMDSSAVNQVFSDLSTNPAGVIAALSNITPEITTTLTGLPATVSLHMPSGLALAVDMFGAVLAGMISANQAAADPSTLTGEGLPALLNGLLNGQQNVSLLDGMIKIPMLNGLFTPTESPLEIDLNLGKLLDTLGLGNLPLTNLVGDNLSGLEDALKSLLGGVQGTLGGLINALGLSGDKLSTLLGDGLNGLTLSGLLGDLGLGNLPLGSTSLTGLLADLGLNSSTNLNSLPLDTVLTALGVNPNVDIGLSSLLTNLGFGSLLNEGIGSLIPS